tara:strand:+ start:260 stop:643 length:384 start_codon:yes stop_codon:yes gene_type:complete
LKIPLTISIDVEMAETLKKRFGKGKVSNYVVSLINADMAQIEGTDDVDTYARLVGILRQQWFQINNWSEFHEYLAKIDKDWAVEKHPYHHLFSKLQELKENDKIRDLVTKWLRNANYDEQEIKSLVG